MGPWPGRLRRELTRQECATLLEELAPSWGEEALGRRFAANGEKGAPKTRAFSRLEVPGTEPGAATVVRGQLRDRRPTSRKADRPIVCRLMSGKSKNGTSCRAPRARRGSQRGRLAPSSGFADDFEKPFMIAREATVPFMAGRPRRSWLKSRGGNDEGTSWGPHRCTKRAGPSPQEFFKKRWPANPLYFLLSVGGSPPRFGTRGE